MKKRKRFTREFKLEVVRLLEEGEKPASELARELGIRRNLLYKWKETIDQKGKDAFPGKGKRTGVETQTTEIACLKRELAQAKEDVEILKKAAAFFAKELK
jgi:transposase